MGVSQNPYMVMHCRAYRACLCTWNGVKRTARGRDTAICVNWKSNIKNWDLKDIEIQNAAIWIDNLGVNFIADGNMASKIDESNNTAHNENQKTKSVRLKDLLTEKIDFLKIDIEGAEYEVLVDCESKLSFVENLFIEFKLGLKNSPKSGKDLDYDFNILNAVIKVNDFQKKILIPKIEAYFNNNWI